MLGSNFAMVSLIVHASKAVSWLRIVCYAKLIVWLWVSSFLNCPWNRIYWLRFSIPIIADAAIPALLGDAVLSSFGVRRFTVLHFLLAVSSLALVLAFGFTAQDSTFKLRTTCCWWFCFNRPRVAQGSSADCYNFLTSDFGYFLSANSSRQLKLFRSGFYSWTHWAWNLFSVNLRNYQTTQF